MYIKNSMYIDDLIQFFIFFLSDTVYGALLILRTQFIEEFEGVSWEETAGVHIATINNTIQGTYSTYSEPSFLYFCHLQFLHFFWYLCFHFFISFSFVIFNIFVLFFLIIFSQVLSGSWTLLTEWVPHTKLQMELSAC